MDRRRKFSRPKFKTNSPSARTAANDFSAWYFPAGKPDWNVYREIGNRWQDSVDYQLEEKMKRESELDYMED